MSREKAARLGITTALLLAAGATGIAGQSPSIVLADGGIQLPDGTVQTTAGVSGAPVQDTGQMQCFDEAGNSRACRGTGEDAELLVGIEWPTPRFSDNADGAGSGRALQHTLDPVSGLPRSDVLGLAAAEHQRATQPGGLGP